MRRYDGRRNPIPPLAILAIIVALLGIVYLVPEALRTRVGEPAQAQEASVPGDEPVARVASELGPSAVQINVTGVRQTPYGEQEGEGLGSGVIYRSDGYVITNHHVVEGATEVDVAFADGTTERGEVVGSDEDTEIAVIRVDRNSLPAATFADADPIVGQLAVAIGSPSGFESTVTSGIVSGVGREFSAEYTGGRQDGALVDLIQTDAAISPATRVGPWRTGKAGLSASTSPTCPPPRRVPSTSASPSRLTLPPTSPTSSSIPARPSNRTSESFSPTLRPRPPPASGPQPSPGCSWSDPNRAARPPRPASGAATW